MILVPRVALFGDPLENMCLFVPQSSAINPCFVITRTLMILSIRRRFAGSSALLRRPGRFRVTRWEKALELDRPPATARRRTFSGKDGTKFHSSLGSVLFPEALVAQGVRTTLFDMVADCLRRSAIRRMLDRQQVRKSEEPAVPHAPVPWPKSARPTTQQLGILMLKVRGNQRFRIVTSAAQSNGLLHATVELR